MKQKPTDDHKWEGDFQKYDGMWLEAVSKFFQIGLLSIPART